MFLSFFRKNTNQGLDDIRHLVEISQYAEALTATSKFLDFNRKNYEGHILRGRILQLMNKTTEAIEFYESIILEFPENIEAYINLIGIYSEPCIISGTLVRGYENEIAWNKIIALGNQVGIMNKDKVPFQEMAVAYHALGRTQLALDAYD
ncbi:MAG: hypothetical protein Q8Q08_04115 [Candidatus Omnitrophota bacterium]|nr:hypothetical protein [Candidatus Omnitrophota bacterium]